MNPAHSNPHICPPAGLAHAHALAQRWFYVASAMTALLAVMLANPAYAQFYTSVGAGCGGLLVGLCPGNLEDGIFTYFVCNMEKLIGEVFGQFYCLLRIQFLAPMSAVMTLAIVIFGVAFVTGIVQATAKDFVMFLLKLAAVWGFATEAPLLIGIAYKFFMGGLTEGIEIVVGAVFTPSGTIIGTGSGGIKIYSFMDDIFNKFVSFTTESAGRDPNNAADAAEFCKNALFAGLVLLAVAFPPLFAIGVFLLIKFIMFFLRAVFGYIYAVIGISFLIVLAPIFLSFAFWRQTKQYFDKWLGHLAGFALQLVIVFAFIAFVMSMDVGSVAKDLMKLVVPNQQSVEAPGIKWPWQICTICEFTVIDSSGGIVGGGNIPPGGSAKCKDNPGKPIDPSALMGPAKAGDRDTLLKLASKVILTLLVLTYVVNAMMDLVPALARAIASAGAIMSPSLTGGRENPLPGEKAFDTFQQQFEARLGQGGNPITAYSEAFTEASKALLVGARDGAGNVTSPGLQQNILDWIKDPLH